MPTSKLYLQNLYEPTLTSATVASSGDVTFTLSITPSYTKWFITFSPSNAAQREIMYFDDVVGSTVYVKSENRWLGWTSAKAHTQWEIVAMKDVAEIFNFFSDNISNAFYVEKKGWLNVNVWGWSVFYNQASQSFSDTALVLTANSTNYIQYDYPTNTISASLVSWYKNKAVVVTWPTSITSITYQVAKESYIDFVVALNTALPSQPGNAGKYLQTDATNASWQNLTQASTTVAGVVEVPTTPEVQSLTTTWATWSSLVVTIDKFWNYYSKWDWSDGDIIISSNTSLTRDMFYNNLTVNTWVTLSPDGYAVYVAGTLTLSWTAKITRNGNSGWNASWATWGTAASALASNTCWTCEGWVAWASGWTWVWTNWILGSGTGSVWYATTWTVWATWGNWWGNPANWSTWWAWPSATQGSRYNRLYNLAQALSAIMSPSRWLYTTAAYVWTPWAWSGGSWTWNWAWAFGGGGGGSGWAWGNIFIYANIIAGTGTIEAKWGNWGNWAQGSVWCGWGWGWAWGSWGIVLLAYNSWTPYTITLTWGTWGTAGAANTFWNAGTAWATGTAWQSIIINK